jgi:hypothetical protein
MLHYVQVKYEELFIKYSEKKIDRLLFGKLVQSRITMFANSGCLARNTFGLVYQNFIKILLWNVTVTSAPLNVFEQCWFWQYDEKINTTNQFFRAKCRQSTYHLACLAYCRIWR